MDYFIEITHTFMSYDSPHFDEFNTLYTINYGKQSTVYLGKQPDLNINVAIKQIQNQSKRSENELIKLKSFNHPFITKFIAENKFSNSINIVMEYAESGNLLKFINNVGRLNSESLKKLFGQMVLVIEYLHVEKYYVHRDIKLENILLDRNYNIRLNDFKFCTKIGDLKKNDICGSPQYLAPEMILGKEYNQSVDIWGLGVLIYFSAYGKYPFNGDDLQSLLNAILMFEPYFSNSDNRQLVDLLKKMFKKDPNERITITQIKAHEYFKGFDFDALLQNCSVNKDEIKQRIDQYSFTEEVKTKLLESKEIYTLIERDVLTDKISPLTILNSNDKLKTEKNMNNPLSPNRNIFPYKRKNPIQLLAKRIATSNINTANTHHHYHHHHNTV